MQAAAQALGMMQSDRHHSESLHMTLDLHRQGLHQQQQHHEDSMKRSAQHHKHEQTIRWQLYSAQREFAVDMARREALRDIWQQRNELTQTMLIVSTLLFGCTYTTLVDGVPTLPAKTNAGTLIAFSSFVSSSLFILLLCIVMNVTLYRRISQYQIHRPLHRYRGCLKIHKDFNSYYSCHCQSLHDKALTSFYVGAATSYVGCALLFLTKIHLWYNDSVASTILFIAPATTVLMALLVGMWYFPDKTHSGVVDYGGLSAETEELSSLQRSSSSRGLYNLERKGSVSSVAFDRTGEGEGNSKYPDVGEETVTDSKNEQSTFEEEIDNCNSSSALSGVETPPWVFATTGVISPTEKRRASSSSSCSHHQNQIPLNGSSSTLKISSSSQLFQPALARREDDDHQDTSRISIPAGQTRDFSTEVGAENENS